ncbi:MAG: hypothetical protein N2D54_04840 [Chloroflexota bacterium]
MKNILEGVINTRDDEIACDDCHDEVGRFVEMLQEGQEPENVMPLVQHHLTMCGNCHEEFEALIKALEEI